MLHYEPLRRRRAGIFRYIARYMEFRIAPQSRKIAEFFPISKPPLDAGSYDVYNRSIIHETKPFAKFTQLRSGFLPDHLSD